MKLCRVETNGRTIPACALPDGTLRDLSEHLPDMTATQLAPPALDRLATMDIANLPPVKSPARFAPVLDRFNRIFCIGLNYSDHAEEANLPVPDHPILFMKACPTTGANDPIILPKGSQKTDWEIELGAVIGTRCKRVSESTALDHVAGYCIVNDISERSYQMDFSGQWVKGKSCDSFAPVGPYLVTTDDVPDPQNLDMFLDVSGSRRQTGNTRTMIFSVAHIISHISQFLTLEPGDLIATGTPPGVGMGMKPQQFLKVGDTITAGITGLGEQSQTVIPDTT